MSKLVIRLIKEMIQLLPSLSSDSAQISSKRCLGDSICIGAARNSLNSRLKGLAVSESSAFLSLCLQDSRDLSKVPNAAGICLPKLLLQLYSSQEKRSKAKPNTRHQHHELLYCAPRRKEATPATHTSLRLEVKARRSTLSL